VDLLRLLAVGMLSEDFSPTTIARFVEVSARKAEMAIGQAREAGLLSLEAVTLVTVLEPITRDQVEQVLSPTERSEVHERIARHLFTLGSEHLERAIKYLRAAGECEINDRLMRLADNNGRLLLSLGEYAGARDLLAMGHGFDLSGDLVRKGHRLCDLAMALDGLGLVEEGRAQLASAVRLGEAAEAPGLVARAAVMHTLPVDWYAGDVQTVGFLMRAEAMEQSANARAALLAARALAEIRIPLSTPGGEQVAWVTRPSVAQPLAEKAVLAAEGCHDEVRCLAQAAWRNTHRSPALLERRREMSGSALDLAQSLRLPSLQMECAVWNAVDALEAGDRAGYDRSLAVAGWVSSSDGNPRLRWRTATLALGAALLDGDLAVAATLRVEVADLAHGSDSPSSYAVELFFLGQELIGRDDPEELMAVRIGDEVPGVMNPVAMAAVGYVWARTGDPATGLGFARRALRQIASESSYLLVATRVAAVALAAGDRELVDEMVEVLNPWADRVSVDGNGWWCDGPVSLWLALLHRH
jgi:tetratricopeptide (TPR) repeat protein